MTPWKGADLNERLIMETPSCASDGGGVAFAESAEPRVSAKIKNAKQGIINITTDAELLNSNHFI